MNNILDKFKNDDAVISLCEGKGSFAASSFLEEALLIASAYKKEKKKYLIVKNNLYNAQILYDYLVCFVNEEEILPFFCDETQRIETLAYSKEMLAQRLYTLNKVIEDKPVIVVTHTLAYLKYLPSVENFKDARSEVWTNQEIKKEDLVKTFINAGYKRVNKVSNSLEFSLRGAIIDYFGINYENPIRIEFFGDEIDSIRFFDINSQRTISLTDKVSILPATEFIINDKDHLYTLIKKALEDSKRFLSYNTYEELEENINKDIVRIKENDNSVSLVKYYGLVNERSFLKDYLNPDSCVFFDYNSIKQNYELMEKETCDYKEELFLLGRSLKKLSSFATLETKNKGTDNIYVKKFKEKVEDKSIGIQEISVGVLNSKMLVKVIKDYLLEGYKVKVYLNNDNQIASFKILCLENLIDINKLEIYKEHLIEGFAINEIKEVYFSSKEVYGTNNRIGKYFSKYHSATELTSYEDLRVGDYVVHDNYGIGIYKGLETIETSGMLKDYLNIHYKNDEKLFVPLEQFSLIRKYIGSEGSKPTLNKLGSADWENTKKKIKSRVKEVAIDLIKLYEDRSKKIGFAFSKDDELQKNFEEAFIYEPTKDQKKAIKIIKEEMEKDIPMDTLLCGDVGFGKTEVAFVAAFKAIKDSKQVAMLCPTTLLSFQHYNNAIERFKSFGVRIEFLNRFKTLKEQEKIIKDLKDGKIDFIIGTHRLLSSDVRYKDLGLLIVDEEQRFGVEHKEKIKNLKNTIDVLTLSATPIPRTMQMSLIGLRTLIQIETPPINRLPVQTFIAYKNEKLIKEIIERELARNGQVFYLYNNTSNIGSVARKIEKEIVGARVGFIHGKMDKEVIEEVSKQYYDNKINVLVCTTIIENGIDVQNANTIIIEDAEKFGLAQLYQIKGRVGRGDRLGYAYLLIKERKQISEVAQNRLKAIKELSELGSGYKIALKDLSIRGAGDILGARQAGFIENVGMDLYFSLLKEAIEEEKGVVKEAEKKVFVQAEGYIPINYAQEDTNKIELYKKLEKAKNFKELVSLNKEIEDMYGRMPRNVYLLFEKKKTELILAKEWVKEVNEQATYIDIYLSDELSKEDGIGVKLFETINQIDFNNISLSFTGENIRIRIRKKNTNWLAYISKIFDSI